MHGVKFEKSRWTGTFRHKFSTKNGYNFNFFDKFKRKLDKPSYFCVEVIYTFLIEAKIR